MNNDKVKIVLVGGGSVGWSPKLICDFLQTPGIDNAQYAILDIDKAAGIKMIEFGNKVKEIKGLSCEFQYTNSQQEAFMDADFVLITISTGGLDAMQNDIEIPEEYGIYQTVGDTVGPGGWSRALRNIPVFAEMAKNIEKYSNDAVVLNYSNPMSVLTNVIYKVTNLKCVGLCHGLFEVYSTLMKIFDLDSEEDIKVNFGGTNHFFWILDLIIKNQDGYKLLKEKIGNKSFADIVTESYEDGAGFHSDKLVTSELLDHYGYLSYVGDRHISEFLPNYLTGNEEKLKDYKLVRTSIKDIRNTKQKQRNTLEKYISGEEELPTVRSRETAADIIGSIVNGREFIDVINVPNIGQISNLPMGSIVETLGVVNSLGFTPINVGALPEPILNIVYPHIKNQDLLVESGLEGNLEKALWALYNDPLCSHLTLPKMKEMGLRLFESQKDFLKGYK